MKVIRPKETERDIQKTILDGLSAMRIWHVRMNSGAMFGEYGGKKRMLRFGRKGMADILAIRRTAFDFHEPIWIEVKRPGQDLSEDQVNFRYEVIGEGHTYILAHSWEDVQNAL